jgi:hypothetical protein
MGAFAPLPLLEAGGWNVAPPPDIDPAILPGVFRGAAATDFPAEEAVAAVQQPVLLAPWVGDPGHPVSTAERLHDLLPHATLDVLDTPDALRALGGRIAGFFGD